MEYWGLYNKPKAVVHPERKLTGPKKKKKKLRYMLSTETSFIDEVCTLNSLKQCKKFGLGKG